MQTASKYWFIFNGFPECLHQFYSWEIHKYMIMPWHADVIALKCIPHYEPCVRGFNWSLVDSLHKRPVIKIFDVSFDVSLNKQPNKQSVGRWIEMLIWCHCIVSFIFDFVVISEQQLYLAWINNHIPANTIGSDCVFLPYIAIFGTNVLI